MNHQRHGAGGAALETGHLPDAERTADAWARAVRGTSFVSMSGRDLRGFLTELTARLIDTLSAPRFDRAVGFGVGEAMVDSHFTTPGSLERTLEVLGAQFAPGAVTTSQVIRLTAVSGALAAGYAQALQDRTRGEQQQISTSTFAARTAAEEARWASEARFGAVFANAHIGISVADIDGRIIEVNRALCEMFDYSLDEFTSRPIYAFIHPDDDPRVWEQVKQMTTGVTDHLRLQKAYFRKDGTQIWTDLVLSLIRSPDGAPRYLVAMLQDITDRLLLQTRLRHQAEHDALTGLPNRALFFERLDEALAADATNPHLGVCYLDLDGFKAVNDTLGHDVGDQLLRTVATRLADALSPEGHLVARMGGDEFVVLVTAGSSIQDVRRVAELALDTVRQTVHVGDHEILISASVGVVERDNGGRGSAELMKAADTTLYWAKNDGRDRYAVFDGERHRVDVHRFTLAAQMPEALRRGEFVVDYQPLIRLSDQSLVGVEALVRWERTDGQRLGPAQFIPVAEETGLIVALGTHVLTQACRQARTWSDANPSIPLLLSVNIAARQIRELSIVEDITKILGDTGWSPHALQLELTESDLMGTGGHPLQALYALADLGVRIAIDDFGTGYSNLTYLQNMPVHELKLAGEFATGNGDQDNIAILTAIINLAHTLGLTVTAESIETAEQCERLRALHCDTGQGWHFAHPGPPHVITALLDARNPPESR